MSLVPYTGAGGTHLAARTLRTIFRLALLVALLTGLQIPVPAGHAAGTIEFSAQPAPASPAIAGVNATTLFAARLTVEVDTARPDPEKTNTGTFPNLDLPHPVSPDDRYHAHSHTQAFHPDMLSVGLGRQPSRAPPVSFA